MKYVLKYACGPGSTLAHGADNNVYNSLDEAKTALANIGWSQDLYPTAIFSRDPQGNETQLAA